MSCRSNLESATEAFHGLQLPWGRIHLFHHGQGSMGTVPTGNSIDMCSAMGPLGCRGTASSTMFLSTGCKACAPVPGSSLPSSLTLVSEKFSLRFSHISLPAPVVQNFFTLFLNMFIQRHKHCCSLAKLLPAAGPFWRH